MLGFCSNEAKKPLPREAVRTLVVLGVAYAMVRVWYTLAVNMHGLAGDAVQVAAIMGGYGFVAVWSRVGIDLAIALLAPRIKTLWKRRWVGVLGASMLVLATAILFYAGSTGSYAPMAALVCALCWAWTGEVPAMLLGMGVVVLIRCLAAHYRWSLPKSDYSADQTQSAR